LPKIAKRSHLRHTTFGELLVVDSKTMSSRRSRHRSAATARSEDLGFSPGDCRKTERSPMTPSGRGRRPQTSPSWPKRARVSPRHGLSFFYTGLGRRKSTEPPPQQAARRDHVARTTMANDQHQNLWLARQPARFPPTKAAALRPNSSRRRTATEHREPPPTQNNRSRADDNRPHRHLPHADHQVSEHLHRSGLPTATTTRADTRSEERRGRTAAAARSAASNHPGCRQRKIWQRGHAGGSKRGRAPARPAETP
jgi:hypothetical protein